LHHNECVANINPRSVMKILVADDHVILRKGLVKILRDNYNQAEFIEASNGAEALSVIRKDTPDLVLMDISMPQMNGIEVLKQVKALGLEIPILILSMQPEDQYAIRVLKAGAHGFLKKDSAPDELFSAISKVLSGKRYVSANVADILAENAGNKDVENLHDLLSDRELQVLRNLADGKSISEIGNDIGLSVNTVSTYRARILQKLKLKNNTAIIKYAIEHNII